MNNDTLEVYSPAEDSLYYAEFFDGLCKVYRRHFFLPPEEYKKTVYDHPFMTNEGHPYHVFTVDVPPDGCIPDKAWYKWMIDKLNA